MPSSTQAAFLLEVVGGADDKACVLVGPYAVVTIGRARDASLCLRDPTVSREHLQVVATDDGVQLAVPANGTARHFLLDGRPTRRAEASPGQIVVVGNTSLTVRTVPAESDQSQALSARTDVTALLTGVEGDTRGLASVHALVEALDAANDEEALQRILRVWASEHEVASRVEVLAQEASDGGTSELLERQEDGDVVVVSVPVICERPSRLAFTLPARHLTNSKRRILVVAGRVFGSAVERARRLDTAARRLEAAAREKDSLRALHFGSARAFLGTSPVAKHLASLVPRLATSDVSVLLDGETGVGKTFFARLIHEGGRRAAEPLRVLNCAAIPETLLESELFGHERGAFTGASAARVGALESAGAGTLFLDEIGELSLASQAKLLRALEEKRFERVGSNRTLELRARVLSATNRDLAAMTASGRFRSDLLFRLSVVKVTIPPLRDRGDDLLLLAEHVLRDAAREAHRRIEGFSEEALDAIKRYPWPGNVRELRNAIEHAIVMGDGPRVERSDLPEALALRPGHVLGSSGDGPVNSVALPADLAWLEVRAIEAALRVARNNRTRAAALLGIPRTTLYGKLAALRVDGADTESN